MSWPPKICKITLLKSRAFRSEHGYFLHASLKVKILRPRRNVNTPNSFFKKALAMEILCSSLIKINFLKSLSVKPLSMYFRDRALSGINLFYCPPEISSGLVAGNHTRSLALWGWRAGLVTLTPFDTWWQTFLSVPGYIIALPLFSQDMLRTLYSQHII